MTDANRSTDVPLGIGSTRSLSFDTANSQDVKLASRIEKLPDHNWSVALWYRGTDHGLDSTTGAIWGTTLLGTDDGALNSLLNIRDSKLEFLWYGNGDYNHNVRSTTSIDDDAWYHLAVVQHDDQTMDLYINGVREVTGAEMSAANFWIDYMMRGFDFLSGQANYTSGKLDDVRVYDHALSAAEVQDLAGEIPEPASALLLGAGALLALRSRRVC
jgi:hypothetical protein